MSILPKAIYRLNAISIKTHDFFFHKTRTNNPRIYTETQKLWIAKAILRKKNKAEGFTLLASDLLQSNIILLCKQNTMVLAQKWHINQWNRIESPEMSSCTYNQLTHNISKNIQWRKDKWGWENCRAKWKIMKLNIFFSPRIQTQTQHGLKT